MAFVNCFGVASFTAVLTELFFPTAPPWYLETRGITPANYTIPVSIILISISYTAPHKKLIRDTLGDFLKLMGIFKPSFSTIHFRKVPLFLELSLPFTLVGQHSFCYLFFTHLEYAIINTSNLSCSCILCGFASQLCIFIRCLISPDIYLMLADIYIIIIS